MRVAIFKQHPSIKGRWVQQGNFIPDIPFFIIQSPRKKIYQKIGAKVIRGYKNGKESIHANLIPISSHITFSDWKRLDGKEVDISLVYCKGVIYFFEYNDKSPTIDYRRQRVNSHLKNHPTTRV